MALLASGCSKRYRIIISCLGSLPSYTHRGLWRPLYPDSALRYVGEGEKDYVGRGGSRLSPCPQEAGERQRDEGRRIWILNMPKRSYPQAS